MLLLVQLWLVTMAAAGDISVSAALNATEFPEDQAVLLTVSVNGTGTARVEPPTGDGLEIVYQGQNSQMQWINGKTSASVSFVFMVQATKPGDHTIAPIKVTVDGTTYTTNPVKCTVTPVSAAQAPPAGRRGAASQQGSGQSAARLRSGEAEQIGFMRVFPRKKKIYSGELVPFTIKAYFRQGMRVTIKSQPRFVGDNFIIHSIDDQPRQSEEVINGTPYSILTWQGTLSPVKEGTFPLEVEMDASLLVRAKRQRPTNPLGSPFFDDPFFDDFFAQYSHREVKVASPKQPITVMDLPADNRPASFSGAIGTYSLAVSATPLDGKVGDPITLKMIVSGTGNFDTVQAPVLSNSSDWKTYPPTENFEEHRPGRGKKIFEQAIVPTSDSLEAVPPVEFSYFDPDAGEYVVLQSDPIKLHLSADRAAAPPAQAPARVEKSPAEQPAATPGGLAPIHTDLGTLVRALVPLYRQAWFIALVVVSMLLLCVAAVLILRQRKLAADPSILVRQRVRKALEGHFQAMEQAAAAGDGEKFRSHCRAAIQEKLAAAWDMEPRAITLADVETRLGGDSPLTDIFRQLEHAGYGGVQLDSGLMQTMLQTVRRELDRL
jgi:hypothetical protein